MEQLGLTAIKPLVVPSLDDLFLGGSVLELYEHSRSMTVGNGYADALSSDKGSVSLYDLSVNDLTPDSEGLLLTLLFLA